MMLEAGKGILLSEPASRSRCGGDAIKSATGKKAARKERRLSETASGSSGGGGGDAVIKSQKLAEGDKAEAGKVKKMWTVTEEYIDRLREEKAAGPKISNLDYLNEGTGPYADALRAIAARGAAVIAEMEAEKAKILEEYDTHGSAQVELVEDTWSDNEMARKLMAWEKKVQQLSS